MFEKLPELSSDLAWMLQSGQVGHSLIIETLVGEFYSPVYRLALSLLDDPQAAVKATILTFQSVILNAHRYRSSEDVKIWIYTIALQVCRQSLVSLSVQRGWAAAFHRTGGAELSTEESTPLPQTSQEAEMWLAVDGLPISSRFPLVLHSVAGLPLEEIARVLHVSESALRLRLQKAAQRLQKRLGQAPSEEWLAASLQRRWPESHLPPLSPEEARRAVEARLAGHNQTARRSTFSPGKAVLAGLALLLVLLLGGYGASIFAKQPSPSKKQPTPQVFYVQVTPSPRTGKRSAPETSSRPSQVQIDPGLPSSFLLDLPATPLQLHGDSASQPGNHSGTDNLSRALHYWGLSSDPASLKQGLQPSSGVMNVMPNKLVDYIEKKTGLNAYLRLGGNYHTLTHLISLGIPVIIERGVDGPDGWNGQYATVIGYDQSAGKMNVTLVPSLENGPSITLSDEELDKGWRAFNYAYLIIYPKELKAELEKLLGTDADPAQNLRNAVQQATREIKTATGRDKFFAYFNLGVILTSKMNYVGAEGVFETAYRLYWDLPVEQRPWRILWYQDSPYEAYFYSGLYGDVITLSERVMASAPPQSVMEESLYWHAVAKNAMGDHSGAIADLRELHSLNPNFAPGETLLQNLQRGGFAPGENNLTAYFK